MHVTPSQSVRPAAQLAEGGVLMEPRARVLTDPDRLCTQSIRNGPSPQMKDLSQLMARARAELCGMRNVALIAARFLATLLTVISEVNMRCYCDTHDLEAADIADEQLRDAAAIHLIQLELVKCAAAGCTWRRGDERCARVDPIAAGELGPRARHAGDPGRAVQSSCIHPEAKGGGCHRYCATGTLCVVAAVRVWRTRRKCARRCRAAGSASATLRGRTAAAVRCVSA
ncbi:hypothetical protein JKP88DRAFT_246930 [Tribonema minus]|uniref:Uncharacterized protein n=1 Tax=Tribonema minus TaxID=303371 RepID=A0A836CBK4_9STRA|nr:hypothetical protein JKP88DRAFT_246930 [Tribonema minus]